MWKVLFLDLVHTGIVLSIKTLYTLLLPVCAAPSSDQSVMADGVKEALAYYRTDRSAASDWDPSNPSCLQVNTPYLSQVGYHSLVLVPVFALRGRS